MDGSREGPTRRGDGRIEGSTGRNLCPRCGCQGKAVVKFPVDKQCLAPDSHHQNLAMIIDQSDLIYTMCGDQLSYLEALSSMINDADIFTDH